MRNKRGGFTRHVGAGAGVMGGVLVASYAASRLRRRQSERAHRSKERRYFMRHPSLRTWNGMAMAVEHDPVTSRATASRVLMRRL